MFFVAQVHNSDIKTKHQEKSNTFELQVNQFDNKSHSKQIINFHCNMLYRLPFKNDRTLVPMYNDNIPSLGHCHFQVTPNPITRKLENKSDE